ncbi:hypothetical protein OIDMADRAFT_62450 [Oidiodendron maius Zn]|uniref:Chromo domain-containing protein n=1 Tax=Oidiodendron maius (strain Zn) TaxID=913774 RepID=A0A0C3C152_OIDMZ|nr:hypothetical protein OIDMADRAFT_62450 [Oidiodendron maius Zn]
MKPKDIRERDDEEDEGQLIQDGPVALPLPATAKSVSPSPVGIATSRPGQSSTGASPTLAELRASKSDACSTEAATMPPPYEDFICSCIEGQPVSTSRTSPATLESACLGRLQSSSGEIEDVDQEWEVRKVIGKEYVDGVPHYLVEWCPTLEPQHSLRHAKELVDEFEVQLEARRVAKDGSKGLYLKMKRRVVAVPDLSRRQQKKKQQGRLRKQK